MVKRVLLFMLFLSILPLNAKQKVYSVEKNLWWLEHKITLKQFNTMKRIWRYAKLYHLQWTAVAIAWQESHFGKELHNLADPSCGIFHQLLPELAERYKMVPNMWNQSRLCDDLMNFDFAFKTFIDTFHIKENICYNKGYKSHLENWKCAVKAYNGNWYYYKNIVNKIKALKIWFRKKGIDLEKGV